MSVGLTLWKTQEQIEHTTSQHSLITWVRVAFFSPSLANLGDIDVIGDILVTHLSSLQVQSRTMISIQV